MDASGVLQRHGNAPRDHLLVYRSVRTDGQRDADLPVLYTHLFPTLLREHVRDVVAKKGGAEMSVVGVAYLRLHDDCDAPHAHKLFLVG